jgi:hypothetical protein
VILGEVTCVSLDLVDERDMRSGCLFELEHQHCGPSEHDDIGTTSSLERQLILKDDTPTLCLRLGDAYVA